MTEQATPRSGFHVGQWTWKRPYQDMTGLKVERSTWDLNGDCGGKGRNGQRNPSRGVADGTGLLQVLDVPTRVFIFLAVVPSNAWLIILICRL